MTVEACLHELAMIAPMADAKTRGPAEKLNTTQRNVKNLSAEHLSEDIWNYGQYLQ